MYVLKNLRRFKSKFLKAKIYLVSQQLIFQKKLNLVQKICLKILKVNQKIFIMQILVLCLRNLRMKGIRKIIYQEKLFLYMKIKKRNTISHSLSRSRSIKLIIIQIYNNQKILIIMIYRIILIFTQIIIIRKIKKD